MIDIVKNVNPLLTLRRQGKPLSSDPELHGILDTFLSLRIAGRPDTYCSQCMKFFMNANNLRMHLRSNKHGARAIKCFANSPQCEKKFITLADAVSHIENGLCRSGLTGTILRKYVIENGDKIVKTNIDGDQKVDGNLKVDAEPELFKNKSGFYECAHCHREFVNATALKSHYKSDAHNSKVFHCPRRDQGCPKEFGSLSSLVRHVEDSNCRTQEDLDYLFKIIKSVREPRPVPKKVEACYGIHNCWPNYVESCY